MKIINKLFLTFLLLSGSTLFSETWPASDTPMLFSLSTETGGVRIVFYKCRPKKLNDGSVSYTVLKQRRRDREVISSHKYEKVFGSDKSVTVHDVLPSHAYERVDWGDEKSH